MRREGGKGNFDHQQRQGGFFADQRTPRRNYKEEQLQGGKGKVIRKKKKAYKN